MKNLTLDDIAKQAGVSRATASRALNDHPDVSAKVRQRIQKIVQETGFQPNAAARSLASQRSFMIGLVIARTVQSLFADPYFPRLAEGISQACTQHDYTFSLFVEYEVENLLRRITRRGLLDGVIVQVESMDNPLIPQLLQSKLPMVVVGRPPQETKVSYLDVDNIHGAYNAVTHLMRLGRQRIGTITGSLQMNAAQDRLEGYRLAFQERGYLMEEALIAEGDFSEAGGYHAAKSLRLQKLDGLFVASDMMARGALRAIREAGLAVPQDIALVSYDDLPPATMTTPFLTTVRQPIKRLGSKAVDTLLDIIEYGPEPPRKLIFDTELIIRETCGANPSAG